MFQLFAKKNYVFLSKGILGEKKIKVAEFWINTQKVRTFFYLIMLTCGTRNFPETLQTSRFGEFFFLFKFLSF